MSARTPAVNSAIRVTFTLAPAALMLAAVPILSRHVQDRACGGPASGVGRRASGESADLG